MSDSEKLVSDHTIYDTGRAARTGIAEAVYCESKTAQQVLDIYAKLREIKNRPVIFTRLIPEQIVALGQKPGIKINPTARTAVLHSPEHLNERGVLLVSGGTSDLPVVEECRETLSAAGFNSQQMSDVGVAGLHRLLGRLEEIKKAKIIIAFAGMEGALPVVLAGLVSAPVIGVPVSVGYGVSEKGHAALSTMLSACSPGLTVVNIDAGYTAACAAIRMLNLI